MPVLYVIPAPLGEAARDVLTADAQDIVRSLRHFVAENPRTARAYLSALAMPVALRELDFARLDEHTAWQDVAALLAPLRNGHPLGLLSEAGCPGVADPGAPLIRLAHREGYRVQPLVGPSSILLALMASGLEGQRFAFCGYLPRERAQRAQRIRALERRSRAERETEIFIETPYRNEALLAALLAVCDPGTQLCIACDLTLASESVVTRSVAGWRSQPRALAGRPAVFLLQAS